MAGRHRRHDSGEENRVESFGQGRQCFGVIFVIV